jgi:1-acyl-sn-glycerol-3-phosphate acyltransferase
MMIIERLKRVKLLKKLVYAVVGVCTFPGIAMVNRIKITGTEYLKNLPKKNVLFVSNHQTYFADVIAFIHIFCAVKWRKKNRLGLPYYLINPFSNVSFVAAEETMKDSLISRLFALGGALTVKRTWRAGGKDISREVDSNDYSKIYNALKKSWVITFPQGTTKPFAPGRKGTAHIIKETQPVVIPVVINGFWRAFNRKGLSFKKKGSILSVQFKAPLDIDYSEGVEVIMEKIMDAIEQSKKFMLMGAHHQVASQGN